MHKTAIKRILPVFLLGLLGCNHLWARDYDIVSFGAKGDGITINTKAIQSAIDQAYADGGGQVIIPKGWFVTGSIVLKSGVGLHLQKGSTLLGSTDIDDYYSISWNRWKALIMADSAQSISITGKGVIDGRGRTLALRIDSLFYVGKLDSSLYQFKEKRPVPHARPQIIQFVSCSGIKVKDVTIRNSATWVQSYDLCEQITIDGIRVESVAFWNNDGIDIIDCNHVRITNSYVNASDDGICVKSYERIPGIEPGCDSIYIGNCTVRSSASAVKLGTSSFGGFSNVVIENIKVYDTYRSAIALESWETGTLENVLIQNIKALNTGNAIFIRFNKRGMFKDYPMGEFKNVTIRNVKATIPFEQPDYYYDLRGPSLPYFHNTFPASITGIPGHYIENVTLENIKITYPGRGNKAYANLPLNRLQDVPEQIEDYPEFSMFGELPAWGFYVRHVNGLVMKDVQVKILNPDYRPAFVFDDVKNLHTNSVEVIGDKKETKMIFHNTTKPE